MATFRYSCLSGAWNPTWVGLSHLRHLALVWSYAEQYTTLPSPLNRTRQPTGWTWSDCRRLYIKGEGNRNGGLQLHHAPLARGALEFACLANDERPPRHAGGLDHPALWRVQAIVADVPALPSRSEELPPAHDPQELVGGVGNAGCTALPVAHRPLGNVEQIGTRTDTHAEAQAALAETDRRDGEPSYLSTAMGLPDFA